MATVLAERPAHVPPELVVNANIYALPGGDTDPQMAWKALDIPGNPGFVWTPHNGGHWILTSAELLWEIFPDLDRVSANDIQIPPGDGSFKLIPNESGRARASLLPQDRAALRQPEGRARPDGQRPFDERRAH